MLKITQEALTFDDVLLVPDFSKFLPSDVVLKTSLIHPPLNKWCISQEDYDIMIIKEDNKKEIVVEGSALVRAGITTDSSMVSPGSDERTCIAVIDDSSQTFTSLETKWNTFRTTFPNRRFYLLQPTTQGFGNSVGNSNYDSLKCPDEFVAETTVNISPLI